ncbi:HxlR family transcriptional regulator [Neisseria animaloris]|uniref:HxlR family transcriptional regulator n=2 Tax=Neisseria TaxID=482 RepID=A0A1X3CLB4_9NEIS|nr:MULTISPECIES: helix-turn-helix domain-containing protein [Neisseria]MDO5074246.1 helix-turn-helix domain-containing protein [Neisseria animaloris]OSI08365.1 ArsR family transcriptional regulator [Neisseria animaloris]OSI14960.1 ArsR family transcriptional regulator [Neisseria dumasiana]OSI19119.1 ArsR family transcriptional regulator [Neisseria dumasiana]OSI34552.1 ArsR family transcriptional regulator [Neisseria dumasiana]
MNSYHELNGNCCPVSTTLDIIGGKWKVLILHHLNTETRRFNELQRLMPAVTQRMLTLQLRELEGDGIVHREVYPQVPPKVEYSLTEFGLTLMPVIEAMHRWGTEYALECAKHKAQKS